MRGGGEVGGGLPQVGVSRVSLRDCLPSERSRPSGAPSGRSTAHILPQTLDAQKSKPNLGIPILHRTHWKTRLDSRGKNVKMKQIL